MSALLLDYCPEHLRADLWANDGFDPNNLDHIADNPDRAIIMEAAQEARKWGLTRDALLAGRITEAVWDMEGGLLYFGLIEDEGELQKAAEELEQLVATLKRSLRRMKPQAKKGAGK